MIGAVRRRLSSSMQRKAQIDQAADVIQWRMCRSKRCHSPAHGFAAGKKRQTIGMLLRGGDGTANTCSENRFTVRSFDTLLHVRELVTERRHRAISQLLRDLLHEPVPHACPSAVSDHQKRFSALR